MKKPKELEAWGRAKARERYANGGATKYDHNQPVTLGVNSGDRKDSPAKYYNQLREMGVNEESAKDATYKIHKWKHGNSWGDLEKTPAYARGGRRK